jgi:predicted alpha/beta-fold hydrolase
MDTLELNRASPPAVPRTEFPAFLARAPWWNGDLQTLRNFLVGRRAELGDYAAQRLFLPMRDGSGDRLVGTLSLPQAVFGTRPLVVLIHGLSGCEDSFYLRKSAGHLLSLGFPVLRLNLRGAGPSRAHCRFQYHAGASEDFTHALEALPPPLTRAGVVAVGYSLGANMLLKYLGEHGSAARLKAAVAISAPLDLAATSRQMMRRRNAIYQFYLLRDMRRESTTPSADVTASERVAIVASRSIWEFDHSFTAPRNGYNGAEDFYERNAALRFLDGVAVPTLIIHALDDPWIPPGAYLAYDWRRNPNVVPLITPRGGHVGFQGRDRRVPWHDHCIAQFLAMA